MEYRLLSMLAEIENTIRMSQPDEDGTTLESTRMVNFHTGVARLTIRARTPSGIQPRGQLQLQNFQLADGRMCLKVNLSWAGIEACRTVEIFTQGEMSWSREINRVAEAWLDGPPAGQVEADHGLLAAAG